MDAHRRFQRARSIVSWQIQVITSSAGANGKKIAGKLSMVSRWAATSPPRPLLMWLATLFGLVPGCGGPHWCP